MMTEGITANGVPVYCGRDAVIIQSVLRWIVRFSRETDHISSESRRLHVRKSGEDNFSRINILSDFEGKRGNIFFLAIFSIFLFVFAIYFIIEVTGFVYLSGLYLLFLLVWTCWKIKFLLETGVSQKVIARGTQLRWRSGLWPFQRTLDWGGRIGSVRPVLQVSPDFEIEGEYVCRSRYSVWIVIGEKTIRVLHDLSRVDAIDAAEMLTASLDGAELRQKEIVTLPNSKVRGIKKSPSGDIHTDNIIRKMFRILESRSKRIVFFTIRRFKNHEKFIFVLYFVIFIFLVGAIVGYFILATLFSVALFLVLGFWDYLRIEVIFDKNYFFISRGSISGGLKRVKKSEVSSLFCFVDTARDDARLDWAGEPIYGLGCRYGGCEVRLAAGVHFADAIKLRDELADEIASAGGAKG